MTPFTPFKAKRLKKRVPRAKKIRSRKPVRKTVKRIHNTITRRRYI